MAKVIASIACALALLAAAPAIAQSFSADMINISGKETNRQKLYVSNGKIRMEPPGSDNIALISDPALSKVFMVNGAQKIYVDMTGMSRITALLEPDNVNDPCPQWRKLSGDPQNTQWACEKLGPDTVNGRKVVKYAGTSAKGEKGNVWLDLQLKFVVKTVGPNASMELQNIAEGPQKASLFVIPAGYKQVDPKALQQGQ
jgi:hypothetical protein